MSTAANLHRFSLVEQDPRFRPEDAQNVWDYIHGRDYVFKAPPVSTARWGTLEWSRHVTFVGEPTPGCPEVHT